jgi:hypothetical protein
MTLAAFGLNCTLKSGPQKSSTQKLLDLMLRALSNHCVDTSYERAVVHDMKLSVLADEGEGTRGHRSSSGSWARRFS